mmetsp:Transcript_30129/g.77716  ORF Transcript_30129/g.77716 Transcript_30129/m.77716 type:complete len:251 (-) Transcript_30129:2467-3219(-)
MDLRKGTCVPDSHHQIRSWFPICDFPRMMRENPVCDLRGFSEEAHFASQGLLKLLFFRGRVDLVLLAKRLFAASHDHQSQVRHALGPRGVHENEGPQVTLCRMRTFDERFHHVSEHTKIQVIEQRRVLFPKSTNFRIELVSDGLLRGQVQILPQVVICVGFSNEQVPKFFLVFSRILEMMLEFRQNQHGGKGVDLMVMFMKLLLQVVLEKQFLGEIQDVLLLLLPLGLSGRIAGAAVIEGHPFPRVFEGV